MDLSRFLEDTSYGVRVAMTSGDDTHVSQRFSRCGPSTLTAEPPNVLHIKCWLLSAMSSDLHNYISDPTA